MATIEVDVDINIEDHLEEVYTSDLIEELELRSLSKKDLLSKIVAISGQKKGTLLDELKLEIVLSGIENKSITELEAFFKQ